MRQIFKKINRTSFWICLSVSVVLLLVSWIMPPQWIIDSSVIQAVAELLGFSCIGIAIHSIEKGMDVTLRHGNTELTIENDDEQIDSEN